MIGNFCRNFQHLRKSAEKIGQVKLLFINGKYMSDGMATIVGDTLVIFNRVETNVKTNFFDRYDSTTRANVATWMQQYGHFCAITDKKSETWYYDRIASHYPILIMLPNDFNEKFDAFIKNNNKQFTQTISKFGLCQTHHFVTFAYVICNESINFFSWILKNVCTQGVNPSMCYIAMQWNARYGQSTNKLSKGTITAYSGVPAIIGMLDEMNQIRTLKRANDAIMQFNSTQKHILKELAKSKVDIETLNRFGKLSDVKRQNFIRKMSTIDDYSDIMHQMSNLCEMHFKWNKEAFLEYLANTKTVKQDIVVDKGNFLILKVYDYEGIKRLGKTTNWCISKNKRYWNDYVERKRESTQYVIFDFDRPEDDEYSIVGFTVDSRIGITNAHSFTNANLVGGVTNRQLESFLPCSATTIGDILANHDVPLDIFMKGVDFPYKWEKSKMMEYLSKHVEDADVVFESDYRVVISSEDNPSIRYMFPHAILERIDNDVFYNIDNDVFYNNILMFFDFTKSPNDSECLLFSIIREDDRGQENGMNAYNFNMRQTNISFSSLVSRFGLPFNIIKRNNDVLSRIKEAFQNNDVTTIRELLSHADAVSVMKKNVRSHVDEAYMLESSIFDLFSVEVLRAIYDNGLRLTEILPEANIANIVQRLVQEICNRFNHLGHIPTSEDFDNLMVHTVTNRNSALVIGYMYIFNEIMSHENSQKIISNIAKALRNNRNWREEIVTYFARLVLERYDTNSGLVNDIMTSLALAACNNNITWLVATIPSKTDNKSIIDYVMNYAKEHKIAIATT